MTEQQTIARFQDIQDELGVWATSGNNLAQNRTVTDIRSGILILRYGKNSNGKRLTEGERMAIVRNLNNSIDRLEKMIVGTL